MGNIWKTQEEEVTLLKDIIAKLEQDLRHAQMAAEEEARRADELQERWKGVVVCEVDAAVTEDRIYTRLVELGWTPPNE